MIQIVKDGYYLVIQPGNYTPVSLGKTSLPSGVYRVELPAEKPPVATHAKELFSCPRISIGVKFCYLKCPYCANASDTSKCNSGQYGSQAETSLKLLEWVSRSNPYFLFWNVGEPTSPTGIRLLAELNRLSDRAKRQCQHAIIFTNGIGLVLNHGEFSRSLRWIDDCRIVWTISLLGEGRNSHLSPVGQRKAIEKIARLLAKMPGHRVIKVALPDRMDYREVDQRIKDSLFEILHLASPDHVEPTVFGYYADTTRYKTYHPNFSSFMAEVYAKGFSTKLFLTGAGNFDQNDRPVAHGSFNGYNKITQADQPHLFILPDRKTTVDVNRLRQSYSEICSVMSQNPSSVNPGCQSCDAVTCCVHSRQPNEWLTANPVADQWMRDAVLTPWYSYGFAIITKLIQIYGTDFPRITCSPARF